LGKQKKLTWRGTPKRETTGVKSDIATAEKGKKCKAQRTG